MDDVSLLNFICQEFQLRPNWEFIDNKVNEAVVHVQKFTVKLDFNGQLICTAEGRNKKDAKFDCAKRAICLVAPKVFALKYADENAEELKAAIERDNAQVGQQGKQQNDAAMSDQEAADVQPPSKEDITLSDPLLPKMTQLFQPYAPYSYLKQAYCQSLHKGAYQLFEHEQ